MWYRSGESIESLVSSPFKIGEVLVEYDGPKLFVLTWSNGSIHLAHWCGDYGANSVYLTVPISLATLDGVRKGAIPISNVLKNDATCLVVEIDGDGNLRGVWRNEISRVPDQCLPQQDVVLPVAAA